jgi:type III pantothenate kinase
MSDLRLLVDLGNTRVKWMWVRGDEIDVEHAALGDFAALEDACRDGAAPKPRSVLISSVADPELTRKLQAFCRATWGIEAQRLRSRAEQGGVRCGYADAGQLGVDRWLAIVGAVHRYGRPLVVWDLGTATTLDAVDGSGQHLGGWILPGPSTMLDALRRRTQLKVPEELKNAGGVRPGRSTAECIARGVLAAQVGSLGQLMDDLSARGVSKPRLVVTGGAADMLVPFLEAKYVHDPWLVFRGMLVD